MSNVQQGYIPVTGGRVWYKIVGANKVKIPLLTLHGGPGAPHDYLEPLEALADERPVVFYDQLGCGSSDKPKDTSLWTVERFVEELQQVREALTLKKVHILGQSWGATLATDYMLTKKLRNVMSLVLSAPFLSTSRWIKDQKTYIAELPKGMQEAIQESEDSGNFSSLRYREAMMMYYKLHLCRLRPWPACLNRAFQKFNPTLYEYMWGPSEFSITGTLKNYERVDRLQELRVPVLFTCGCYDEAAPETVRYYQKNTPGSEIFVFEDASHQHHLEKPEEYVQVVRSFLRRIEEKEA